MWLSLLCTIRSKQRRKNEKKFRRFRAKHFYQNITRYDCGELSNILSVDERFNNFICTSVNDFENSTIMIGPKIKKIDTHSRKTVPAKVRSSVSIMDAQRTYLFINYKRELVFINIKYYYTIH